MFKQLCTPAKFYFIIATVSYILMLFQNINCNGRFHLGSYSCPQNTSMILVLNALYIAIWTYVLNLICTINKNISWIIVLFPFILLFIGLGIVLINGIQQETFSNSSADVSQATLNIMPSRITLPTMSYN
uniref:Transmembrane protein n=1 Tax=viral metagenome TaxID=1070528 RepID=A0A6C0B9G0_9ZZZZ